MKQSNHLNEFICTSVFSWERGLNENTNGLVGQY